MATRAWASAAPSRRLPPRAAPPRDRRPRRRGEALRARPPSVGRSAAPAARGSAAAHDLRSAEALPPRRRPPSPPARGRLRRGGSPRWVRRVPVAGCRRRPRACPWRVRSASSLGRPGRRLPGGGREREHRSPAGSRAFARRGAARSPCAPASPACAWWRCAGAAGPWGAVARAARGCWSAVWACRRVPPLAVVLWRRVPPPIDGWRCAARGCASGLPPVPVRIARVWVFAVVDVRVVVWPFVCLLFCGYGGSLVGFGCRWCCGGGCGVRAAGLERRAVRGVFSGPPGAVRLLHFCFFAAGIDLMRLRFRSPSFFVGLAPLL
jgi:hypothetical protein